jgi:flagellar hook-associated protein 1 FlgK
VLDYNQIAAGTATPAFILNFTTAGGYAIDGAGVDVDGNGNFTHEGIDYSISGTSADGDSFVVGLNTNAAGDNRNIRLVAQLQTKEVTADGRTLGDGYIDLVNTVGSASALAKISKDALQVVHDQAVMEKDKISGVSLDQEAADLIRFQQAFQAAAQIIQTSNKMFDSIVNIR